MANPTGNNACYVDVTLCKDWEDFQNFHDWAMSHGYMKGKSIDRIQGTGGYSPDNCRWTDAVVQSQNRNGWKNAEVPLKGVFKAKPRNGEVRYISTGKSPYYWRFSYRGKSHQKWGFETPEEAYEDKCKFIEEHYNGLVIP